MKLHPSSFILVYKLRRRLHLQHLLDVVVEVLQTLFKGNGLVRIQEQGQVLGAGIGVFATARVGGGVRRDAIFQIGDEPFMHRILLDQFIDHIRADKGALASHQVKAIAAVGVGDVLDKLEGFLRVGAILEDIPGATAQLRWELAVRVRGEETLVRFGNGLIFDVALEVTHVE